MSTTKVPVEMIDTPDDIRSRVLIETVTASNQATVEFSTGIDSTYDIYEIDLIDVVPATDGEDLYLRTSTDGGSTFDSGANDYAYSIVILATGSVAPETSTGAAQVRITNPAQGWGSSAGKSLCGSVSLFNPHGTTSNKKITFDVFGQQVTGDSLTCQGGGVRLSTSDIDAIQFLFSSGNIASGKFKLYGVR